MNFDIPDWGNSDAFSYHLEASEAWDISKLYKKGIEKKTKKVKRKLDKEHQPASKKKKKRSSDAGTGSPAAEGRKLKETKTVSTEEGAKAGGNGATGVAALGKKKKKKKKNNKYKALNIQQQLAKEIKLAGVGVAGQGSDSVQCRKQKSGVNTDEATGVSSRGGKESGGVGQRTGIDGSQKKKRNKKKTSLPSGGQGVMGECEGASQGEAVHVAHAPAEASGSGMPQDASGEDSGHLSVKKKKKKEKKCLEGRDNQLHRSEKGDGEVCNGEGEEGTGKGSKRKLKKSKNRKKEDVQSQEVDVEEKKIIPNGETDTLNKNDERGMKKNNKKKKRKQNMAEGKPEEKTKETEGKVKKKQKKKREEDEEELVFDDEDVELDPKFQCDFSAVLKQLDFDGFFRKNPELKAENKATVDGDLPEITKEGKKKKRKIVENQDVNEKVQNMLNDDVTNGSPSTKKKKLLIETVGKAEEKLQIKSPTKERKESTAETPSKGKKKMPAESATKEKLPIDKTKKKSVTEQPGKDNKKLQVESNSEGKGQVTTGSSSKKNDNTVLADSPITQKKKLFDKDKLAKILEEAARSSPGAQKQKPPALSPASALRHKMETQLAAARFRQLNEQLYTYPSSEAVKLFRQDPQAFKVYHQGYQGQVQHWPLNPLSLIRDWLCAKPCSWVVADLGCGEGSLMQQVPQKVHSLDLVAANPRVTACDMAHTPLATGSVDVAVFCLSLMGTNIKDFMVEANRILRVGGIMKVAEVESRFEDVKQFVSVLGRYGFHCLHKDTSHSYFYLFEFKKNRNVKKVASLPEITLKPCMYKKR